MSEDNTNVEEIENLLNKHDKKILDYIDAVELKIDTQDKIIANLMKAYFEVTSAVESLISEVMSPRTDEEKEGFRQDMNKRHAEQLRTIQSVANDVEARNPEDVSASILDMAAKYENPSTS